GGEGSGRSWGRGSARPTKGMLLGSLIREMLVRSSPRKRGTQVFGPLDSRFRGNERNSIQRRKPHYAAPRRTRSNHSSSESTATPRSLALPSFEPAPGPATT